MNNRRFLSIGLSVSTVVLMGCNAPLPEITWNYGNSEVVGSVSDKEETIDIDIYVDATVSMEGFALSPSSNYGQFLDLLESSAIAAWKEANPRYYKFGTRIKPVERDEFLTARNKGTFYHENGVKEKTYIDSVIERTDAGRLSVVITDLFQDDGDVNTMVDQIKQKCFAKGVQVGILGVKSHFDGMVYDCPGSASYRLNTTQSEISSDRPFYAFVFGNPYNMGYLFEALKSKPFVKENQMLLISQNVIVNYTTELSKTKNDAKFIVNRKVIKQIENVHNFSMKGEGSEAKFDLKISLEPNSRCADFDYKKLELVVYKKEVTDPESGISDSTLTTTDITLEDIQRTEDGLTATLVYKNGYDAGNYSYLVYLKTNELNGLIAPSWIEGFSTENPVENSPTENETYNLSKLVNNLIKANSAVKPTYISKFYLNIYKK